ncbi:Cytochrome P450 [Macleaya cordata]|uniref:Cytochrome P450 n=1 Tax=Macleaya cordata TaxID=56857 RepID=A0A200Q6V0_MACCD|nr:Cytochrome P450 [Macleaya cordata]
MNASIFFILLLVLLPVFLFICRGRRRSPKKLPPGSLGIPIVGQSLSFLRALQANTGEQWLEERVRKYGPISKLNLFGASTVFLTGPTANKFLFTNDGTVIANQQPKPIKMILGDRNLTELRGEDHKRVRGAIVSFLKPEVLKKNVVKMDGMVRQHFETQWKGRQEVKVYPLIRALTFDLICSSLFGLEQGVQRERLLDDFHLFTQGMWSVPVNLPFTRFNTGLRASRRIRQLVGDLMVERRAALERGQASPDADLITCFLSVHGEDHAEMITEKEILDNAIVVMFAGHETSSSLITFLIQFLANYPVAYDSVLHEHEEIAKNKAPGEPLTWEDLGRMKYTWRAAMETLRMIPPVFGTFRTAQKDFEYEGYLIPKGWQVFRAASTTHMDDEIFPESRKFDPERFENQGSFPPYSFVPFGGGLRVCPGYEYAKIETLITIHYLVTEFTWKLCCTDEAVTYDPIPMPSQGLLIQLEPKATT